MLDPRFVAPVTDAIQDIYEESQCRKPVLYLLTAGSDPTFSIDELAKKKKKYPTDKVSMGEGQERVARDKNNAAFITGGWVILQNSHLGIGYMCELEDVLLKTPEIDEAFRRGRCFHLQSDDGIGKAVCSMQFSHSACSEADSHRPHELWQVVDHLRLASDEGVIAFCWGGERSARDFGGSQC